MTASDPASDPLILSEREAFEILAFLFSSAELCLKEPTYYGSFRLVDAASRLMGHMLAHDPERSAAFLRDFKAEVDQKKAWMMWDREAFFDFLRAAPAVVAGELLALDSDPSLQETT